MANRLIHQTSPYLLQHAHNPVDWYPWGTEALKKARDEQKVILVSIGYSACHWCHVMERESFEDPETASLMNQYFVNIKIDREERPDLDQVYMDAVQLISGSGGWPLNVFLTPEAKPFYGGTYFPPTPVYNRSSWKDVLNAIQSAWQEKKDSLLQQADDLTNHLKQTGLFEEGGGGDFSAQELKDASENLLKTADTAWGGFGSAPKFPQTFSIQFLLRQHYFTQGTKNGSETGESSNRAMLNQALLSLDKMIMGGIYDQLGGGFSRYSTDAHWLVPHFEKMLYDNALLISVLSEAYQLTGRPHYRETIEHTMNFIRHEWQDDDGGFFSAYDADSEGEEGKFYTWTMEEVRELLPDPENFQIFSAYYGMEEDGNWEDTNILWVPQPAEVFCTARGLELEKTKKILSGSRQLLLNQRDKRIKPLLDDKKIMGWNALMITACCNAWMATGQEQYLVMATRAGAFIEEKLRTGNDDYHHNYKNGIAANPAFLEDFACYIQSQIKLSECTGDMQYLENATRLTNKVLADFFDDQSGLFFYTHKNQKDIIFRKKEMYDGATQSGNSLMGQNLFYLATLLDIPEWKQAAMEMSGRVKKLVSGYPGSFAGWAQLQQFHVFGLKEVAVVGEAHRQVSGQLLGMYLPDKVFQQAATGADAYPLLRGKIVKENETLIYLCFQYHCQRPVSSIAAFRQLIGN